MDVEYTYWEADDGWFVGYLNAYPDHLTQGADLAELEEMLADVYQIRQEEEAPRSWAMSNEQLEMSNGSG